MELVFFKFFGKCGFTEMLIGVLVTRLYYFGNLFFLGNLLHFGNDGYGVIRCKLHGLFQIPSVSGPKEVTARCGCPFGQKLGGDGKTCHPDPMVRDLQFYNTMLS